MSLYSSTALRFITMHFPANPRGLGKFIYIKKLDNSLKLLRSTLSFSLSQTFNANHQIWRNVIFLLDVKGKKMCKLHRKAFQANVVEYSIYL